MDTGHDLRRSGALLVMSVPLQDQAGPVAVWITAAGWGAAAANLLGEAWLVTPDGVMQPGEARRAASRPQRTTSAGQPVAAWLPSTVRTLLKDARNAVRARRFRQAGLHGPWNGHAVRFVWQRHDLFHTAGLHAARRLGCPLVVFVDAPIVWEARRWGVRRPGWGRLLERLGERPMLRSADLVACVSDEVAEQVRRLGVPHERVVVTPCSVDVEAFHPAVDGTAVRTRYGLSDRFVVGWTGSFRRFHGLEVLLEAFARVQAAVPDAALLLVGDGAERRRLAELAACRGLRDVVFTGTVAHDEVAQHVAAMDVAVVTAPPDAGFHYSPLKLKEYMACGRPVVAPRVGQIPSAVADRHEGLLVEPGDADALASAIERLHAEPALRARLGGGAVDRVHVDGVWQHQLEQVLGRLAVLVPG